MHVEAPQPSETKNNAVAKRPTEFESGPPKVYDWSNLLSEGDWIEWTLKSDDGVVSSPPNYRGKVVTKDDKNLSMQMVDGEFAEIHLDNIHFEHLPNDETITMERELAAAMEKKEVSESKKPPIIKQVTDLTQYVYL